MVEEAGGVWKQILRCQKSYHQSGWGARGTHQESKQASPPAPIKKSILARAKNAKQSETYRQDSSFQREQSSSRCKGLGNAAQKSQRVESWGAPWLMIRVSSPCRGKRQVSFWECAFRVDFVMHIISVRSAVMATPVKAFPGKREGGVPDPVLRIRAVELSDLVQELEKSFGEFHEMIRRQEVPVKSPMLELAVVNAIGRRMGRIQQM